MNIVILFAVTIAVIGGVLDGFKNINNTKKTIRPSKNLISFIFIDPFERST